MSEIVEIGKAQDLILGGKALGSVDSEMAPYRWPITDSEEDE
jgi:hypothetical protein